MDKRLQILLKQMIKSMRACGYTEEVIDQYIANRFIDYLAIQENEGG